MRLSRRVPCERLTLRIEENHISYAAPCLAVAVGGGPLPGDFVAVELHVKNGVQDEL